MAPSSALAKLSSCAHFPGEAIDRSAVALDTARPSAAQRRRRVDTVIKNIEKI